MFCVNCGKPLVDGAAFCSSCGSRVTTGQPPAYQMPPSFMPPPPAAPQPPTMNARQPQAAPAPDGEGTVLILKMTHRLSMANNVICHVVFKRQWLVLAHLSKSLQSAEIARLQASLKAQNMSFMKRAAAQTRFWVNFSDRYETMSTDAILAEDPLNRVVRYDAMSWAEFKSAHAYTDEEGLSNGMRSSSFQIGAGAETIKLTHQLPHSRRLQETLTSLFGPRLKYKK